MTKNKAQKFFETFFVVEGRGPLPLDMLRYDSCFPAQEEDSSKAQHLTGKRRIVLRRRSVSIEPPTYGRWSSFGWEVITVENDLQEARKLAAAG